MGRLYPPRGMLTNADHQLLALWAATCVEHGFLDAVRDLVLDDQQLQNEIC